MNETKLVVGLVRAYAGLKIQAFLNLSPVSVVKSDKQAPFVTRPDCD